jgi:hypothetical protein
VQLYVVVLAKGEEQGEFVISRKLKRKAMGKDKSM